MLVMKVLRPDRFTASVRDYVAEQLGPKFASPPRLDLTAVLEDRFVRSRLRG